MGSAWHETDSAVARKIAGIAELMAPVRLFMIFLPFEFVGFQRSELELSVAGAKRERMQLDRARPKVFVDFFHFEGPVARRMFRFF